MGVVCVCGMDVCASESGRCVCVCGCVRSQVIGHADRCNHWLWDCVGFMHNRVIIGSVLVAMCKGGDACGVVFGAAA